MRLPKWVFRGTHAPGLNGCLREHLRSPPEGTSRHFSCSIGLNLKACISALEPQGRCPWRLGHGKERSMCGTFPAPLLPLRLSASRSPRERIGDPENPKSRGQTHDWGVKAACLIFATALN